MTDSRRRHVRRLGAIINFREVQGGSVLILMLFVCLAVAVVVQTLSATVICATRAVADESVGRRRLHEKDEALAILRQDLLADWQPTGWKSVQVSGGVVEVCASGIPDSGENIMGVGARQAPSASRLTTSAWLERGRDGIDLPAAALVAEAIVAAPGRETPWVALDGGESTGVTAMPGADIAVIHLLETPLEPLVGSGCEFRHLDKPWRLDLGWALLCGSDIGSEPGVIWLSGRPGSLEHFPDNLAGSSREEPVLVVVTGGANLDARGMGEIYGVVVVDDGSLLLEGTTIHGAVLTTGRVDMGRSGCLLYSHSILRWATDSSLTRTRLVPGSRWEGTE